MNKQVGTDGTVGKGLEILDIVVGFGRAARFSEVLEVSPYPKATVYRFLQTLTNQGMLSYDEDRHTYTPGMRLVRIAHHAWNQSALAPLADPFISSLAEDVGETVHLSQMENSRVVFIDKKSTPQGFRTMAQQGRRAPAHCTGVGKVMMAFMTPERRQTAVDRQQFEKFTPSTHQNADTLNAELDVIAKEGVAYDREEHEQGIISIAAPIFGNGQNVIGAISVVTSTLRLSLDDLEKFRPALLRTATQIGNEAALWPYPIAQ